MRVSVYLPACHLPVPPPSPQVEKGHQSTSEWMGAPSALAQSININTYMYTYIYITITSGKITPSTLAQSINIHTYIGSISHIHNIHIDTHTAYI